MKKLIKNYIYIFKWSGDQSIIKEITDCMSDEHKSISKVFCQENDEDNMLYMSEKFGNGGTYNSWTSLGKYLIYDESKDFAFLQSADEEYIKKLKNKYKEL